jgi:hypothetical protein
MNVIYAFRYFQTVAVVPPLFLAAFAVTVAAAAMTLTHDTSAATDALTPVLLLQLFAASSGFDAPARRGHYDLLLTSGTARWHIALAHCLASVMPGITSWICVGMLELAASHGAHRAFASGGTCIAFFLVSTIAWATATAISRAPAAVGWLLVMTIPPLERFASPVQLLGTPTPRPVAVTLSAVFLIAMIPVAWAFARIVRGPVPLEAAQ